MDEIKVVVKGDEIRFVYGDDMLPFTEHGEAIIKRASHVEPVEGGWQADLAPVGGPKLGPFKTRKEALGKEICWLFENNIPRVE